MTDARTHSQPCAFTLIELMVVIALIALLLGITLPVLHHAQRASRRVICMNNLRQMGLGLDMYIGDHDNHLPYVEEPIWRLGAPIDWSAQPRQHPQSFMQVMQPYLGDPAIYRCPDAALGYPAHQPQVTYRFAAANNRNGNPQTIDKLITPDGVVRYDYSLKYLNGRPYELKHVDAGDIPFHLVDGPGPYYLARDFIDRDESGAFLPPHQDGFNQLYLDLHVRFSPDPDLMTYP